MFSRLTPVAIRTFNGKRVVFIVPGELSLPGKFDGVVIPEKSESYQEQCRFVSDVVLQHRAEKIIVVTSSPVVLSDAFACQIYVWRRGDDGNVLCPVNTLATFGASPERIAAHVFQLDASVGALAGSKMAEWLCTDWTVDRIGELEEITAGVGGGWARAKLREMLEELKQLRDGNATP